MQRQIKEHFHLSKIRNTNVQADLTAEIRVCSVIRWDIALRPMLHRFALFLRACLQAGGIMLILYFAACSEAFAATTGLMSVIFPAVYIIMMMV